MTPSVKAMLPYLGIEMQSRGRDAWGASDGTTVIKRKGPLVEGWAGERAAISTWDAGIFHTRGASVGTPKEEANAHPFAYEKDDGSMVIGIHNGFVSNHDLLNKKYGRDFQVDSQHIWAHRARGLPWSEIHGWGNLAWWEGYAGGDAGPTGPRMNLLRFNSASLHVAHLTEGEYVFCSEIRPVQVITQMLGNPVLRWFPLDEFRQYWFQADAEAPGGVRLWRGEKLIDFPKPTPVATYTAFVGGAGTAGPHRGSTWHSRFCLRCNTIRVAEEDEVLCFNCLREYVESYMAERAEVWAA